MNGLRIQELIVQQTVTSAESAIFFELLANGSKIGECTLDPEIEPDASLLAEARQKIHEAWEEARREADDRGIFLRGQVMMEIARDRYAETQAMVRAFAEVVFPEAMAG